MDLVQQGNVESASRNGRIARNRVGIALVIVGAALCVSISGWLLVANAGAGTTSSAGAGADPFTQPAAIEFRGTEHVADGCLGGRSVHRAGGDRVPPDRARRDGRLGSRSVHRAGGDRVPGG